MTEIMKQQVETGNLPTSAVTYKDRIFRMVFKEKKELLALYNAMNETDYDNPEDLMITTLDNAIYMSMKNDVSFLLYDKLTLYEHQSTDNPNMPLRNLLYVADVYSALTKDKRLYGTALVKIPEPKFVVFYNGVKRKEEQFVMRLSDMYETASEAVSLELKTQVFNVNLGYNRKLMEKCKALHDYAVFVDLVRKYRRTMRLEEAMEKAIDECVQNNVLSEFLKQNKAEVQKMGIYEYNEEEHIRMEREDAREEGRREGETKLLVTQICKKLKKNQSVSEIADVLEEEIQTVQDIYNVAVKYAPDYDVSKIMEELQEE